MAGIDKCAVAYGINYGRKQFYDTCPRVWKYGE